MRALIFLIGLIFLCPALVSAAPARLDSGTQAVPLGPHLSYYMDESRALTVERMPEVTGRFLPVTGATPNLGYSKAAIWFRFSLQSDAPVETEWFLDVAFPRLDRVEVYSPSETAPGGYEVSVGGDSLPFFARQIEHRNLVFRVRARPGAEQVFYIRVTTTSSVQFPATLYAPERFRDADHNEQALLGMFYGVILVMAAYNFFIFAATRDRSYLFYVLYIAGMGLSQLTLHGWAFEYLWPNHPWWNKSAVAFFPACTLTFANLFAKHFLATRGRSRVSTFCLNFFAGCGVVLVAAALTPVRASVFQALSGLIIVSAIATLVIGFAALATNHRPAVFFLTAQTLFLLAGIVFSLGLFGVLPSNLLTRHLIPVGTTIELVLLSFGLADRIRTLRKEKEAAEANAAFKEKDTEIFRLRNVELAEANRTITDSVAYAQSIQRAILPTPEEFAAAFASTVRLFRPKDLVSGDFYWLYRTEAAVYFAVADCTGHGVPGAFMSMIGNDLLNQLVIERGMTGPADILAELHIGVRRALRQDVTPDAFDGMDIAFCRIAGREVTFAGAKRPLYITAPNQELIEIRGDRRGIAGTRRNEAPVFTEHRLDLPPDGTLWLTTDGFADQCNHVGHSYGSQRLKRLLNDISAEPPPVQIATLERELTAHQGATAQRDDITVVGVKPR